MADADNNFSTFGWQFNASLSLFENNFTRLAYLLASPFTHTMYSIMKG